MRNNPTFTNYCYSNVDKFELQLLKARAYYIYTAIIHIYTVYTIYIVNIEDNNNNIVIYNTNINIEKEYNDILKLDQHIKKNIKDMHNNLLLISYP